MALLFFHSPPKNSFWLTHFFIWLINYITKGKHYHVAILVNGFIFEAKAFKGVIKTPVENYNPQGFDLVKIPFKVGNCEIDSSELFNKLNDLVGSGYDYIGLLTFLFPFIKHQKNRYYCSELANLYFVELFKLQKDTIEMVSPANLYNRIFIFRYFK